MAPKKADANTGLRAFWSSLPGILTGLAAVVAAVVRSLPCSSAMMAPRRRHHLPG